MKEWIGRFALAVLLSTGSVRAEETPLSIETLAHCAAQVQHLRAESSRLKRDNSRLDVKRGDIDRRSAALRAERASLDPDDLEKGLDYHQRLQQHLADTRAFNAQIEQIRRDIDAVSTLRRDYDRDCARRSYRRADLDALPAAAREAMRAGLAGVEVPYLDPVTAP